MGPFLSKLPGRKQLRHKTILLSNWAIEQTPRPTHLTCHRKSSHPTHHQLPPIEQAPNGHGVRTFLLEGRLHRHLQPRRWRSPSPPTIRTHAASQGLRPLARSGSRPFTPAVQGGAANTRTLAAQIPPVSISTAPLIVLRPHSQPTPRRCWRWLGPLSRALCARINNNSCSDFAQYIDGTYHMRKIGLKFHRNSRPTGCKECWSGTELMLALRRIQ